MQPRSWKWISTAWMNCVVLGGTLFVATCLSAAEPAVLEQALAGPLGPVQEIVFATRMQYDDPHWYANIGYFCDDENNKAYPGKGGPDVGKLCALNVRTRQVRVLLDTQGGTIRDPDVHYDAEKVLFSYRKAGEDNFHLYEINLDGTNLRALTDGPYDDYEPTYLPDGGIVFVSTRCQCWVNCWMTQVGVLYRCDADGGNIRRISHNAEHDNTPAVMPDGKILYTRWEYVDRSQVEFHHLWTINPDGSGEMTYFGNMHPGIVMIDAKPIPNSRKVLVNFSPGHGVTDHKGHVAIVSPAEGPDDRGTARQLTDVWPPYKDPYPLSEDCFIVARENSILVMNGKGKTELLYEEPLPAMLHEPRPVMPRQRERQIAPRTRAEQPTGQLVLADVYQGRQMEGVQRGDIKKLLVLELLPKQVNFSGGPDLVSWLGTFSLERVLGTVPVEPDGSASFEVPACRPVFFVALDEQDMSVQRMHSFVSVMPGETTSCVGCHESRTQSPATPAANMLLALQRPPSKIEPFAGLPDVIDFPRDIQPILDRHCVECHTYTHREGGVLLTGDLGSQWSHAYFHLLAHLQVSDGRNGLGNYPPRTIGSAASPLLKMLDPSHYNVQVSPEEWRTVWMWIESGAPYAGSYAGLRNAEDQTIDGRAAARVFVECGQRVKQRCSQCHAVGETTNETGRAIPFNPITGNNPRGLKRAIGYWERVVIENDPQTQYSPHILINLTRPELSPLLLGPLAKSAGGWESCGAVFANTEDPDYQHILASMRRAKADADVRPRYGTPGFQPNRQYIREMKRYGVLAADYDPRNGPLDFFQTDQDYWRTYWYTPPEQP